MAMHNPPHPGEFITGVYLEPNNLSGRELAATLGVSASTLNRILTGNSAVSPEMALRLSKALGRSPESWLAMQSNYDLWQARQRVKLWQCGQGQAHRRITTRCAAGSVGVSHSNEQTASNSSTRVCNDFRSKFGLEGWQRQSGSSLNGNAASNALRQYGLSFDDLNTLQEYGLIIADYNSWMVETRSTDICRRRQAFRTRGSKTSRCSLRQIRVLPPTAVACSSRTESAALDRQILGQSISC
jgi:addiction module HigA family antidote